MKLLCQALRAATVDTFSVVLVVWIILGVPTLGYQSLTGSLASRPDLRSWWQTGQRQLVRAVFHPQAIKRSVPVARADRSAAQRRAAAPQPALWFASPRSLRNR